MKLICWILGHRFNIMEYSVKWVYLCDRCERCGKKDYENAEIYKKYQAFLRLEGERE